MSTDLHVKAYELLFSLEKQLTRIIHENLKKGLGQAKVEEIARKSKRPGLNSHGLPWIFYLDKKMEVLREQGQGLRSDLKEACEVVYAGFIWLKLIRTRNSISHAGLDEPISAAEFQELVDWVERDEFKKLGIHVSAKIDKQHQVANTPVEGSDSAVEPSNIELTESLSPSEDSGIPNNLDGKDVEHRKTGFVGRRQDLVELETLLFSRSISPLVISGPGGVGKSALALQFMRGLQYSAPHVKLLDAMVFLTLKQEYLSWDGVKTKDRDISLKAIKAELHDAVCGTLNIPIEGDILDLESKRVLVCVDNLENVLLRDQEAFLNFLDLSLPRSWKYLITSRIPVEGVRLHRLECMGDGDARTLCEEMFDPGRTTYRFSSDTARADAVSRIVRESMGIPLAIKFSVDSVINGGREFQDATRLAREQILDFSYRTFIEGLAEETVEAHFICALHVLEEPSNRAAVCEVGDITANDGFYKAFNRLRTLSIVSRDDGTNLYELSEAIRNFITVSNSYDQLLSHCRDRLKKIRISAQGAAERAPQSQFELGYISRKAPAELVPTVDNVVRLFSRKDSQKIREIWESLNARMELYGNSGDFHYILGLANMGLKSDKSARICFESCLQIDPDHVMAQLMLGVTCRSLDDDARARATLFAMYQKGYADPSVSSVFFAEELIRNLVRSLVYNREYELALKITSPWKEQCKIQRVMGIAHAFALRRYAEEFVKADDLGKFSNLVLQAMDVLDGLLVNFPGENDVEGVASKLVELITSTLYTKHGLMNEAVLQRVLSFASTFGDRLDLKVEALKFLAGRRDCLILELTVISDGPEYFFGQDEAGDLCFIPKSLTCRSNPRKNLVKGAKIRVRAHPRENQRARYRAFAIESCSYTDGP